MAERRRSRSKRPSKDEILGNGLGRIEVMFEELRSQFGVLADAVDARARDLGAQIRELDGRLSGRIDNLELAVRQNSADIRRLDRTVEGHGRMLGEQGRRLDAAEPSLLQHGEDLRELKTHSRLHTESLTRIEAKLDQKVDVERVERLEQRVGVLEQGP